MVYHMPIWLRTFIYNKIAEFNKPKDTNQNNQDTQEKQVKPITVPDYVYKKKRS